MAAKKITKAQRDAAERAALETFTPEELVALAKRAKEEAKLNERFEMWGPEAVEEWTGVKRKCTNCGKTKLVIDQFGLRRDRAQRGHWTPVPQCRECRNKGR